MLGGNAATKHILIMIFRPRTDSFKPSKVTPCGVTGYGYAGSYVLPLETAIGIENVGCANAHNWLDLQPRVRVAQRLIADVF
jgi:hypothetical protein